MKNLFVTLSALSILMFPLSAMAEDPVQLPTTVVRGVLQTPSVRVILSRSRPSSERAEQRTTFTREIVTSTAGSPF